MIKKMLIKAETSEKKQQTGEILKSWLRTHAPELVTETGEAAPADPDTDAIEQLAALAARDGEETQRLPVVKVAKKPLPPQFIEYRHVDNPLIMLFGACLETIARLGSAPETLFIAGNLLPELRRAAGRAHIGIDDLKFRFPTGTGIVSIPVKTDQDLPEILKFVYGRGLSRDSVIAIIS